MKRILTAIILLPLVILLIIFGNKYIMDVIIAIVATIAIREYAECIKSKAKFIYWVRILIYN